MCVFGFQGDLEQLTILPAPDAVGTQCGSQRTPVLDAELLATVTAAPPGTDPHGRRSKARKGYWTYYMIIGLP